MRRTLEKFYVRIGLANDEVIRSWSSGEVIKPETINYKTGKPVFDGFFCQKIFGPVKDYECACGHYKRIKNKGKICERCRVEVTESIVRRQRFGHIELDEPIVHIWFFKSIPSKLAIVLEKDMLTLEAIIYYRAYVIVENNNQPQIPLGAVINLETKVGNLRNKNNSFDLLHNILEYIISKHPKPSLVHNEAQNYLKVLDRGEDSLFFIEECLDFINQNSDIQLETGGLAIEKLLLQINLNKEIAKLRTLVQVHQNQSSIVDKVVKRLQILNHFRKSHQKLEWMVTRTIPVLPPELRPIVQLEGGRFATAGINRFYNELLIRKNRLQKYKEKNAPNFMLNELRVSIQETVDLLFDKTLAERNKKLNVKYQAIKSLATNLKGKTGRFRQNLLGKRADYSAGSVIVGGPQLKLDQCGLPRDIAIVLFHPFIIAKLLQKEKAINKKVAEKMIFDREPVIWQELDEIIQNYPVILNRAPTLHRLGIQGFYPKLVRGKAIMLHPLVTTAFNADFDGDRMPIHLPLTEDAKQEVRDLLLSTKNILNPRNGSLITMPSQDMILGIYYLTIEEPGACGEGMLFDNFEQAYLAYENRKLALNARIWMAVPALGKSYFTTTQQKQYIITTVGKLLFNQKFPPSFHYLNQTAWREPTPFFDLKLDFKTTLVNQPLQKPYNKKQISAIINDCLDSYSVDIIIELLDAMKDLGFQFSTVSGFTISAFDLFYDTQKTQVFDQTDQTIQQIRNLFQIGGMTSLEKRQLKITAWLKAKNRVEKKLQRFFTEGDTKNSLLAMVNSGARGSISNFTQLVGMRGLMINTKGEIIDTPIKSSLIDGLTELEFFISTYGARKGMVDTALKTADSGYLTRRLVDATHDLYITQDDCGTTDFYEVGTIVDPQTQTQVLSFKDRIYGRFAACDYTDAQGQILVHRNQLINHSIADKLYRSSHKKIKIRSILTCAVVRGVCIMCFGLDLARNQVIKKGEAVGVLAAQSIGEPATQLTMRTFHTGGVADVSDITQGLPRIIELFDVVAPKPHRKALLATQPGIVKEIKVHSENACQIMVLTPDKTIVTYYTKNFGALVVKKLDQIVPGQKLTDGVIDLKEFIDITSDQLRLADYIIQEVQKVYCLQGIDLADKYIEIVIRKLLSRRKIIDAGDSDYINGEEVDDHILIAKNQRLRTQNHRLIKFKTIICGLKTISSKAESFLSAASFQETTKVLIQSAIERRVDKLYGLKENVIVGNLIPVGTGYDKK